MKCGRLWAIKLIRVGFDGQLTIFQAYLLRFGLAVGMRGILKRCKNCLRLLT
jgi:hypothetical protein